MSFVVLAHLNRPFNFLLFQIHTEGPLIEREKRANEKNLPINRPYITPECRMKMTELGGRGNAMSKKLSPEKNEELSYQRNLITK